MTVSRPPPANTGFLNIDGACLEYAAYGPSPGEASSIVLLHEGLGSVSHWRDFPAKLAAITGRGVFAYSRAGYGNSSAAKLPRRLDYMSREATDTLPKVLNAFGIRSGVLLGHSDGASIAAIHAGVTQDERVLGLILIAPHFFVEKVGVESIQEVKNLYENRKLRAKLEQHHKNVDNAFYGWCDAWLDPDFGAWNVSTALDSVQVPVLAIQGTFDQYGTMAQIEELRTRLRSPLEVMTVNDCGHSPHREKSETVLDRISEFIARVNR